MKTRPVPSDSVFSRRRHGFKSHWGRQNRAGGSRGGSKRPAFLGVWLVEPPWPLTNWVLIWCGIVFFLAVLGLLANKGAEDAAQQGATESAEDYGSVTNGAYGCAVIILICAVVALKLWFGW